MGRSGPYPGDVAKPAVSTSIGSSIFDAIRRVSERCPDHIALVGSQGAWTYGELMDAALRVRDRLSGVDGLRGVAVALEMERRFESIACLLGIMEAGGVYLALDAEWPAERKAAAMRSAKARFVVSGTLPPRIERLDSAASGCDVLSEGSPDPTSDATCIFLTSGTTGPPKAVLTRHEAILRLFSVGSPLDFGEPVRMGLAVSPSWDAFALELYAPLLSGGTVLLCPDAFWHPRAIEEAIAAWGMDTLWLTSSLFNLAMEEDASCLSGLRRLVIGGEKLSVRHVGACLAVHPSLRVWNGYGPVETCVFATLHPVAPDDLERPGGIPLGRPLPGTDIRIDAGDRPAGPGEIGEILIGGCGVSPGYVGQAGLTARRFVTEATRLGPGRFYRTGDRGSLDADGCLHFHGRGDRTVKIRGLQVDLDAVERAVLRECDVSACIAALDRDADGNASGVSLFCTRGDCAQGSEATARREIETCARRLGLPRTTFALFDHFPLNANGKADIARMRASAHSQTDPSATRSGRVGDEADHSLRRIVQDLLGVATVADTDNLVALGLDSLAMARLASKLSQAHGLRIGLADLAACDTLAALTERLEQDRNAGQETSEAGHHPPLVEAFLMQSLLQPDTTACHCLMVWSIEGTVSRERLRRAMIALQRRHPELQRPLSLKTMDGREVSCRDHDEVDLQCVAAGDDAALTCARIRSDLLRPLDPSAGRLWHGSWSHDRVAEVSVFGVAVHHAVFDARSEAILSRDLARALNGEPLGVRAATATRQAAGAQRSCDANSELQRTLSAVSPIQWLPPSPTDGSPKYGQRVFGFHAAVVSLARRHGVLPICVYLAALAVTLVRGQPSSCVTIAVPVDMSQQSSADRLGCRVAMAPVIVRLGDIQVDGDSLPQGVMARVVTGWRNALGALHGRPLPAPDWARRHGSRRFPAQVLLALQPEEANDLDLGDHGTARFHRLSPGHAQLDLAIDIWPTPDGRAAMHTLADPDRLDARQARSVADGMLDQLQRWILAP